MVWKWFRRSSTLRKSATRAAKKPLTLSLEQLENRLLPASVLDTLLPSFNAAAVTLYQGGVVGPQTTAQTDGNVTPVHESGTGWLDPGTSYSYSWEIFGTISGNGTATYHEEYRIGFDNTYSDQVGTSFHEWGFYQYTLTITTTEHATEVLLDVDLELHQTVSHVSQMTHADGSSISTAWTTELLQYAGREIFNRTELADGVAHGRDVNTGRRLESYTETGATRIRFRAGM